MLKWRDFSFRWVVFLSGGVLFLTLGLGFILFTQKRLEAERALSELSNHILEQVNTSSASSFRTAVADVSYLAHMPGLTRYLTTSQNEDHVANITSNFADFLRYKPYYSELVLVNLQGKEYIHLKIGPDGKPISLSENQFHPGDVKSDLERISQLKEDEIYVSTVGVLEQPEQAQSAARQGIRIGAPVLSTDKKLHAVVFLTYQAVLDVRAHAAQKWALQGEDLIFTNPQGYLLNPVVSTNTKLEERFPLAWQQMASSEMGQFENTEGLFTFKTIYPLTGAEQLLPQPVKINLSERYAWKVITWISPQELAQLRQRATYEQLPYILVTAGALVLLAVVVFYLLRRREKAEQAIRRQQTYEAAFNQLTLNLVPHLDLEEMRSSVMDQACVLFDAPSGAVFWLDDTTQPDQPQIVMIHAKGALEPYLGLRLDPGEGLSGLVWERSEPVVIPDYPIWSGRLKKTVIEGVRTVVGVPLKTRDKVRGVLLLGYAEAGVAFDQERIHLFHRFAQVISLLMDNARLYTTSQLDLAERKMAEQRLLYSQEHFKDLFEHSPVALFEVNFSEVTKHLEWKKICGEDLRSYLMERENINDCVSMIKMVDVNQAALRLFEAENKDQLLNSGSFKVTPGEQDFYTHIMLSLAMGQYETDYSGAINTFSGDELYVRLRGRVMPTLGASFSRVIVSVTDLTAARQAQLEVEKSLTLLKAIIDTTVEGVLVVYHNGQVLVHNQQYLQLFNLPVDVSEMSIGEHQQLLARQMQDPEGYLKRLKEIEADQQGTSVDLLETKTEAAIERYTAPYLVGGEIVGRLWTYYDITERVRVQRALEESEQRFRSVIEQSTDGVALVDEKMRIIEWNQAMTQISGVKREEALGQHFISVIKQVVPLSRQVVSMGRTQKPLTKDDFEMLAAGEGNSLLELEIQRADGRLVWVQQSLFRIEMEKGYRVCCMLRDVNDLKNLEANLTANQKLADLGTLAGGMAHEMNSPLQVITGSSEALIRRIKRGEFSPDVMLRSLGAINRAGWRCADVTHALQTYARSSSGQREPADLNQIVDEQLMFLEGQLAERQVKVETCLEADLPTWSCDRSGIGQALMHLITNARDALRTGGCIRIETQYDVDKQSLILRVADNGSGVPEQIHKKIFDPFFTTKPIGEGTGLGLSIVLGVVRAHGGIVELESQPNQGSCFTLIFPLDGRPLVRPDFSGFGRFDE